MTAVGFILTFICVGFVLVANRQGALLGVFAGICYLTQHLQLDVGGFHLHAVRIVLLAGLIRILAHGDLRRLKFNGIDWILIFYAVYSAVIGSIRMGVWQEELGSAYNTLLAYFVFRCLISNLDELKQLLPSLAVLIVPLAMSMLLESLTGNNIFITLMGGSEPGNEREGRLRCVGSFRGCHTAGSFGATLIPFFAALFFAFDRRRTALIGFLAATAITYASNSSGPLMGYLSALIVLGFWPLRTRMKTVKRWILVLLIGLGCTMRVPIWYIFSKVADITGGDGWYRSYLMDQCWKHMSDWWLMGTDNTAPWSVTHLSTGGADLCNMFVACAADAGLGSLIPFILLFVYCFRNLGLALKRVRGSSLQDEILLWCLGSILFAHLIILFSVTYWDQMFAPWWGLLAIISSVTSAALVPAIVDSAQEDRPLMTAGAVKDFSV